MFGNSFTFANDMPLMLAEMTGAEVVQHTRGGARLAEHLNPSTKLGAKTLAALEDESWDYVILQEMSNAPVTSKKAFLRSVTQLCELIHHNGATPLLYATWAYKRNSEKMSMSLSYDEMAAQMYEAYHEAAARNNALVADVGQRFYELSETQELYAEDGCHPNELGSRLAAKEIAGVIAANMMNGDRVR
jgi:lysophospholipase L1-like esterase